jgi:hypothetical protein
MPIFPTQAEALTHASANNHQFVYAIDKIDSIKKGAKKYGTFRDIAELKQNYNQLKHAYELLPNNRPCNLYFDLEWNIESLPNVDDVLTKFVYYVREKMEEYFSGYTFENEDVYISTASGLGQTGSFSGINKASFHIVIQTCKKFRNNKEIQHFIDNIRYELTELKENDDTRLVDLPFWHDKNENEKNQLIIDDGVYSSNRCFRMFGQSKKTDMTRPLISYKLASIGQRNSDDGSIQAQANKQMIESLSDDNNYKHIAYTIVDELDNHLVGYYDMDMYNNDNENDYFYDMIEVIAKNIESRQAGKRLKFNSKAQKKIINNDGDGHFVPLNGRYTTGDNNDDIETKSISSRTSRGSKIDEDLIVDEDKEVTTPLEYSDTIPFYLSCIPNRGSFRQIWDVYIAIMFAVKNSPDGLYEDFVEWARQYELYNENDTAQDWAGVKPRTNGYNRWTLRRLARICRPELFINSVESRMEHFTNIYPFDKLGEMTMEQYDERYLRPFIPAPPPKVCVCLDRYINSSEDGSKGALKGHIVPEDGSFAPFKARDASEDDESCPCMKVKVKEAPIDLGKKCICIKSQMGTGKTSRIKEYITQKNSRRILFLSPRQVFAQNMTASINKEILNESEKFVSYLNVPKNKKLSSINRLVVQMESLHKLKDNFQPYDLLIMDESESNLMQFSSRDTMWQNIEECSKVFEELLKTSRNVICADAFLSSRTIDAMRAFIPENEIHIIENQNVPEKRVAIDVHFFEIFKNQIFASLEQGKKIVVVWGSVTKAREFELEFMHHFPIEEERPRYKFYHAGQSDSYNKLTNVDEDWSNIDLLMYSPIITVGVNFDPSHIHFDQLFVCGSASTCSVRDIFQSTMRVRHLSENKMYYYICDKVVRNSPDTLEGTRLDIKNRVKAIDNFDKLNLEEPIDDQTPDWIYKNNLFNEFERNFSRMNYYAIFNQFLKICGYTSECYDFDENKRFFHYYDMVSKKELIELYHTIHEIDDAEFEEIDHRIRCKMATKDEKLQYEKYKFIQCFKKDTDREILASIWNECYHVSKEHKREFFNIRDEKRSTPQDIRSREKYKKIAEIRCIQFEKIKQFTSMLGLESSMDVNTIIPYEKMEELNNYINENIEYLNTIFVADNKEIQKEEQQQEQQQEEGENKKKKNNNNNSELRTATLFVKRMFNQWSGAKLETVGRRRTKTVNGKRIEMKDYKLTHKIPYFHLIRSREDDNKFYAELQEENNKLKKSYLFD